MSSNTPHLWNYCMETSHNRKFHEVRFHIIIITEHFNGILQLFCTLTLFIRVYLFKNDRRLTDHENNLPNFIIYVRMIGLFVYKF